MIISRLLFFLDLKITLSFARKSENLKARILENVWNGVTNSLNLNDDLKA